MRYFPVHNKLGKYLKITRQQWAESMSVMMKRNMVFDDRKCVTIIFLVGKYFCLLCVLRTTWPTFRAAIRLTLIVPLWWKFLSSKAKSSKRKICCPFVNYNDPMQSQFFTSHDNSAVITCANLWPNLVQQIGCSFAKYNDPIHSQFFIMTTMLSWQGFFYPNFRPQSD